MNWNRSINIDRELSLAVLMGPMLAWISAPGHMMLNSLVRGELSTLFGTWHMVVGIIAGAVGIFCGVLTAPLVIWAIRSRPFTRAVPVVYGPPIAVDVLIVLMTDAREGVNVRAALPVGAALILGCVLSLVLLPRREPGGERKQGN